MPTIEAYRSISIVNEYTIEMNKYYFHNASSPPSNQSILIYLLDDANNNRPNRKRLLALIHNGQIFFSFGKLIKFNNFIYNLKKWNVLILKGNYVLYEKTSSDEFPYLINIEHLLYKFSYENDEVHNENGESDYTGDNGNNNNLEFTLFSQSYPYELIDNCYLLDIKGNEFFLKNFSLFSYQPTSTSQASLIKLENDMGSRMNLKKRNLGIDFSSASSFSSNRNNNVRVVKMFQSKSLVLTIVEKTGDLIDFHKNNMRLATVSLICFEKIKVIFIFDF
jgi:hypothetical protein